MNKTRKIFVWIVSVTGIVSICVLIYALRIDNQKLMQISIPISILMGVIRALIAIIPLDKPKIPTLNPRIETDINDNLPGNVPGKFHYFTGRKKYMREIHQEFRPKNKNSSTRVLILSGLGGVGKSEIAKAYAIDFQKEYKYICWIDAEKEEGIRSAYTNFATEYKLAQGIEKVDDIIKEVIDWMRNHYHWLFIFDNARNKESIDKYIPNFNTGNILITSRYTQWEEFKQINIEEFTNSEACNFLKNYTEQDNEEGLEELVEELGYFPLALKHAGAYMKTNKTSYNKYLKEFRKNKTKKSQKYLDRVTQIVAETLKTSFKFILKKASRQLINLCAFMSPKDINRQWFVEASEKLPTPLRKAVKEEVMYNEVIAELTAYSLVTIDYAGNISIHRLVQDVIRNNLKKEQIKWRNYCVEIIR